VRDGNCCSEILSGHHSLRLQPFRTCQFGLALVKSPESLSFEFESASDVKGIKRTNAEYRTMSKSKSCAHLQGMLWECHLKPKATGFVVVQLPVHFHSFSDIEPPPKLQLSNGVCPFGPM
jgi:hypothetical protein